VWIGMLAPAGTPSRHHHKLNGEIAKLVRTDEVKKLIATTGMDADPDTPEQSVPTSRVDYDKWQGGARFGATVQ